MIIDHEFEVREFTFTWKIKNFMWCKHKCDENLRSPEFTIDEARRTNFFLSLYPNGKVASGFVSLYVNRCFHDEGPELLKLRYEFAVVDFQGVSHVLCAGEQDFEKGTGWGYRTFLERTSLFTCDRNRLLSEDVLTVSCRIAPAQTGNESQGDPQGFDTLSQDLTILYLNKLHCDIILCCEDQEFPAHKAVLLARCPKFIEMISPQFLEQAHSEVSLAFLDADAIVLEALLLYFYSGKVEGFSAQQLQGLHSVAEIYQLNLLKSKLILFESKVTAVTSIKVKRHSFTWTIDSLKNVLDNNYTFTCFDVSLLLSIKEFLINNRQYIEIHVHCSEVKEELLLTCKLSLTNAKQECLNKAECKTFISDYTVLKLSDFIKYTGREENSADFSLTLDFELKMSEGGIFQDSKKNSFVSSECKIPLQNSGNLRKLSADFTRLLASRTMCDVILYVTGIPVFAHKAILSARSPVFSRILATTSHAVINGLDYGCFYSLLTYIYSGTVDLDSGKEALSMYIAAKHYEVYSLQEKCMECMKSNLNVDNSYKILLLAHAHKEQGLEDYVKDFICSRHTAFLNSESWIRFTVEKPNLARKLLGKIYLHNQSLLENSGVV